MNLVELELYKWQLHRMGAFTPHVKLKQRSMGVSKFAWWVQFGAFISMLPRQSGKTELLIRMAKIFQEEKEPFLFVVPTETMKNNILQRISINSKKIEVVQTTTLAFNFQTMEQAIKNTNLLVDEYNFLRRETIKNLFGMDWKSISMVGGMNL